MGSPLAGDFGGYDPRLGTWQQILANIIAPTLAAGQRGGRARGGLPGGAAPPLRLPAAAETAAPVVNATDMLGFPGLPALPAASSVPDGGAPTPQPVGYANPALDAYNQEQTNRMGQSAPARFMQWFAGRPMESTPPAAVVRQGREGAGGPGAGSEFAAYQDALSRMVGPAPGQEGSMFDPALYRRSPLQLLMTWVAPFAGALGEGLMSPGGPGSQRRFLGSALSGLTQTAIGEANRPTAVKQALWEQYRRQLESASKVIDAMKGQGTYNPTRIVQGPDGQPAVYNDRTGRLETDAQGNPIRPVTPATAPTAPATATAGSSYWDATTGTYVPIPGGAKVSTAKQSPWRLMKDPGQNGERYWERTNPETGEPETRPVTVPDPNNPQGPQVPFRSQTKAGAGAKPTAREQTDTLNASAVDVATKALAKGDAQLLAQHPEYKGDISKASPDDRYNAANALLGQHLASPGASQQTKANADRIRRAIHNSLGRKPAGKAKTPEQIKAEQTVTGTQAPTGEQ